MFELIETQSVKAKTENGFYIAPLEQLEQNAKQETVFVLRHWCNWSKFFNSNRIAKCTIGAIGAVRQGAPGLLRACSMVEKKLQSAIFQAGYKNCSNAPTLLYRNKVKVIYIYFPIGTLYARATLGAKGAAR